jgi:DNA-directed RNA polymerase subunit M/transcription elongation factor TFIIS
MKNGKIMRFCPDCENILIPKDDKLYCRACDIEVEFDPEIYNYKITKKIKQKENEIEPIIIRKVLNKNKISHDDREAFEEFFHLS